MPKEVLYLLDQLPSDSRLMFEKVNGEQLQIHVSRADGDERKSITQAIPISSIRSAIAPLSFEKGIKDTLVSRFKGRNPEHEDSSI